MISAFRIISARQVALPKQTTVGKIMSADVNAVLLAQNPKGIEGRKGETTIKKKKNKGQKEVLDKIDLSGMECKNGVGRAKRSLRSHKRVHKYLCFE